MPDWELQRCCDHNQGVFIISVAVFTVVILALWRTVLLTPFKLITVFLHETSHALACKLTCGDVRKPLLLLSCFFSSGFVIHALLAVLYWAPSALTSAWRFLLSCVVHCSLSSQCIHIITKQPARIAETTGVLILLKLSVNRLRKMGQLCTLTWLLPGDLVETITKQPTKVRRTNWGIVHVQIDSEQIELYWDTHIHYFY